MAVVRSLSTRLPPLAVPRARNCLSIASPHYTAAGRQRSTNDCNLIRLPDLMSARTVCSAGQQSVSESCAPHGHAPTVVDQQTHRGPVSSEISIDQPGLRFSAGDTTEGCSANLRLATMGGARPRCTTWLRAAIIACALLGLAGSVPVRLRPLNASLPSTYSPACTLCSVAARGVLWGHDAVGIVLSSWVATWRCTGRCKTREAGHALAGPPPLAKWLNCRLAGQ